MAQAHKTSAWPLAQAYFVLIVYASLYPFTGWHHQGIAAWEFLWSPLPRYWTGFDVTANVAGYAPLGFLLALVFARPEAAGRAPANWLPILAASLTGALVSLTMEALQTFLPSRVPSNVDLALNTAGTLAGALLAVVLDRAGVLRRWHLLRTDRGFRVVGDTPAPAELERALRAAGARSGAEVEIGGETIELAP